MIFDEVRESLVGYYILPLCGISYKAFGKHYLNCKLSRKHREVIVYLQPLCEEQYWKNPNFKCEHTNNLTTYVRFIIPEKYLQDVIVFASGLYSQMSEEAKEQIYHHSGLYYKKRIGDHIVTDKKLLALSKHKALRDWLLDQHVIKLCDKGEFIVLENQQIIYHGN